MKLKNYINNSSPTYAAKEVKLQKLINHALFILESFGIPVNGTPRRLERMALVFLALADIKNINHFKKAKDLVNDSYSLKTRDIIEYLNNNFNENISRGSYDDIRRKDLKYLVISGVILRSNPKSATNDATRGYGLNPDYATMLRKYPIENWADIISIKLAHIKPLAEQLERKRKLQKIPVFLPAGVELFFSNGEHNILQKLIIEKLLPRYGYGAKVLYVGDTTDKYLHLDKPALEALNFFEIAHEELPDIIAYSSERNWLYLIEAVHSSGAISETRLLQLKKMTGKCTAEIIFITAFLDRKTFRKFITEIAWETEVWIAENPDHLIHFNGEKFLGPY